jgi:hypothetical protein
LATYLEIKVEALGTQGAESFLRVFGNPKDDFFFFFGSGHLPYHQKKEGHNLEV